VLFEIDSDDNAISRPQYHCAAAAKGRRSDFNRLRLLHRVLRLQGLPLTGNRLVRRARHS
jgi:hypothetical protein